jgi:hypothetical protein
VRGWLALSDWQQSAEYFATHHAELHTPQAAAVLDRIRAEDSDNQARPRVSNVFAALVHPDFAGRGAVGYTYLSAGSVGGLTALIHAVAAEPQLLAAAVRLVEAAAPFVQERAYNPVLLRAAQLVVSRQPVQARQEVIAIRPTVPTTQRVLWVDRYQSLRQALPEHAEAFWQLREDIVHCGDPATEPPTGQ